MGCSRAYSAFTVGLLNLTYNESVQCGQGFFAHFLKNDKSPLVFYRLRGAFIWWAKGAAHPTRLKQLQGCAHPL